MEVKYANKTSVGGFNAKVVAAMSWEEFRDSHQHWGEGRNLSQEAKEKDLKDIYEQCLKMVGASKSKKQTGEAS